MDDFILNVITELSTEFSLNFSIKSQTKSSQKRLCYKIILFLDYPCINH